MVQKALLLCLSVLAASSAVAFCRIEPRTFSLQELPAAKVFSNAAHWLTTGQSGLKVPADDDDNGPTTPFQWSTKTVIAIALTSLAGLFSNAAGIGGGPFYMPIFIAMCGFDSHSATALSHSVVATTALASTLYGLWQRSPVDPNAPMVNFPLALTFAPALLVGTGLGVMFNQLLPEWLQTLGLVILLSWVIYKTALTAQSAWQRESQSKFVRSLSDHNSGQGLFRSISEGLRHFSVTSADNEPASWAEMAKIVAVEAGKRACNMWMYMFGLLMLAVVFLGFELDMSQSPKCSWDFFTSWIAQTLICAAATTAMLYWQVRELHKNGGVHVDPEIRQLLTGQPYPLDEEDRGEVLEEAIAVHKLLETAGVMVLAGCMAGLIGIGGSLIFNPFLLSKDLHPQVIASTAVLLILFSSSVISLSFYFHGVLNVSYAAHFLPSALVCAFIGVMVVGQVVRMTGRASIIVILLGVLMTLGAITTAITGGINSYKSFQDDSGIGFQPFCQPK